MVVSGVRTKGEAVKSGEAREKWTVLSHPMGNVTSRPPSVM